MRIFKNKLTYKLAACIAAVILLISFVWDGGEARAYAASSTTTAFEQSDVMDDLATATINGKPFDTVNYPYDSTGVFKHPEIMTVVEYCYSIRAAQRENYGVYIYFYNPQALNILTASMANKITLGVKYGTDKNGNITVDDYEKFNLEFCSKSTGDYHDLFYKFKIIDHISAVDGKTVAGRVNSNSRRYDISEIELLTVGNKNATAYGVGGTYTFTGYAKGYGADQNAESTLACERRDLETVTLDLTGVKDGVDKRTYWRSTSSSKGAHYQNQINSVFFAIDTNVLEKYGYTLQRIKAEWHEYKTAPAIVIDNKDIYDRLKAYNGVKITEDYDSSRGISMYNSDSLVVSSPDVPTVYRYAWSWNKNLQDSVFTFYSSDYIDTLLPLLFYTNGISVDDYTLTAETLQVYCEQYDKSFENGHLQFNEHDFSADLFTNSVDDGRIRGYNLREFDITNPDDLWQINSYDSTHTWWDRFRDYGFWSPKTDDDYADTLPIQMLKAEDFAVSNVADHLKVNPDDVSKLKDYYNASIKDNNKDGKPDNAVFIFRYAKTDYWSEDLDIYDIANNKGYYHVDYKPHDTHIGEIRQGTQFFDFDILTMTFNKNGDLTTLGCVSSPVDHWSGYTPSVEGEAPDWWKWVKAVLGLIVVILIIVLLYPIIFPILGFIVNGVLWLITAPFKAVGALFKRKKE